MTANEYPCLQNDFQQDIAINFEGGCIININKPRDWTSFDVVKKLRGTIKVKKIGHAGTLDPFATGVLLICTGKATKKVSHLQSQEKEYIAEIEFGKTTDTYDCTGNVLSKNRISLLEKESVVSACENFIGEGYQIPPMYSAIKVHGTRLYNLARQGKTVERTPRKIFIKEMEVISLVTSFLTLKIICSKGTYIRSIANDLGQKIKCGACLNNLIRTRIGNFTIENSYSLNDFMIKYKNLLN